MDNQINYSQTAASYLDEYLNHKKISVTGDEAVYFDDKDTYKQLTSEMMAMLHSDLKYADLDVRDVFTILARSMLHERRMVRVNNIEKGFNKIYAAKIAEDANILLKVAFLKPHSFLKWPRFILMILLFICMASFVIAFFPVIFKAIYQIEYPYFYHWLIGFIVFTILCWTPVFMRAFNQLKTPVNQNEH